MTYTPLDSLLEMCCTEIERRAALVEPAAGVLHAGAAAFRASLRAAIPLTSPGRTVQVAEQLDHVDDSPLAQAVLAAAPELSWIASPRTTDNGREVALAPINDVRELGSLTCGLMLLAPGGVYPKHAHPPQEIYLPISGAGRWQYGGDPSFRTLAADGLVYNNPRDVHSVVADDEPLLALYILWP